MARLFKKVFYHKIYVLIFATAFLFQSFLVPEKVELSITIGVHLT